MDRLTDLIGLLPALVEDLHAVPSGPVICLVDKVVLTPVMKLRFDTLVAKLQSWRNEIVPGLRMEELFLSQRTRASNKRKTDPEVEGSSSTRPQLQASISTSTPQKMSVVLKHFHIRLELMGDLGNGDWVKVAHRKPARSTFRTGGSKGPDKWHTAAAKE
ncbi:hypothetical protein Sste5346_009448 [Sporothrix stenoceras]|uniref:Uncharacterized protein n=1 Tax=Sporothrix stenoceras TaxID=5173 RepID=A0ABR3YJU1_9PEZI